MPKLTWTKVLLVLWLGTAYAAWWFADKVMDYKGRAWKAHVMPVASLKPTAVKASGQVPGKKVGWFLGDSRAAAWPALMPEKFHWENLGVSGYTTLDTRDWFRLHLAAAGPPDVLVIQVGINDLQAAGYQMELLPTFLASAKKNFQDILGELRNHGDACRVVLTTVIPHGPLGWRNKFWWPEALDAAVLDLNQHIKSLAGANIMVMDSFQALETERFARESDSLDDLHLNAQGYEKMSQAVLKLLPKEP